MAIAKHVLDNHRLGAAAAASAAGGKAGGHGAGDGDKGGEAADVEFLKRYIHYCRSQCSPRLNEEASKRLAAFYVEIRNEVGFRPANSGGCGVVVVVTTGQCAQLGQPASYAAGATTKPCITCMCSQLNTTNSTPHPVPNPVPPRTQARTQADANDSDTPPVPITVRQLEAVVRISESLAKMSLQPVATLEHVTRAIELFTKSTMDAVKSGLTQGEMGGEQQVRGCLGIAGGVGVAGASPRWKEVHGGPGRRRHDVVVGCLGSC